MCRCAKDSTSFILQPRDSYGLYAFDKTCFQMNSVGAAGNSFQYAELNIRHTGNVERTLAMVKRAVRMGYDAVAVNIDIGDIVPEEFAVSIAALLWGTLSMFV